MLISANEDINHYLILQEGILKCCISQNTDGLHRRSGLPREGD